MIMPSLFECYKNFDTVIAKIDNSFLGYNEAFSHTLVKVNGQFYDIQNKQEEIVSPKDHSCWYWLYHGFKQQIEDILGQSYLGYGIFSYFKIKEQDSASQASDGRPYTPGSLLFDCPDVIWSDISYAESLTDQKLMLPSPYFFARKKPVIIYWGNVDSQMEIKESGISLWEMNVKQIDGKTKCTILSTNGIDDATALTTWDQDKDKYEAGLSFVLHYALLSYNQRRGQKNNTWTIPCTGGIIFVPYLFADDENLSHSGTVLCYTGEKTLNIVKITEQIISATRSWGLRISLHLKEITTKQIERDALLRRFAEYDNIFKGSIDYNALMKLFSYEFTNSQHYLSTIRENLVFLGFGIDYQDTHAGIILMPGKLDPKTKKNEEETNKYFYYNESDVQTFCTPIPSKNTYKKRLQEYIKTHSIRLHKDFKSGSFNQKLDSHDISIEINNSIISIHRNKATQKQNGIIRDSNSNIVLCGTKQIDELTYYSNQEAQPKESLENQVCEFFRSCTDEIEEEELISLNGEKIQSILAIPFLDDSESHYASLFIGISKIQNSTDIDKLVKEIKIIVSLIKMAVERHKQEKAMALADQNAKLLQILPQLSKNFNRQVLREFLRSALDKNGILSKYRDNLQFLHLALCDRESGRQDADMISQTDEILKDYTQSLDKHYSKKYSCIESSQFQNGLPNCHEYIATSTMGIRFLFARVINKHPSNEAPETFYSPESFYSKNVLSIIDSKKNVFEQWKEWSDQLGVQNPPGDKDTFTIGVPFMDGDKTTGKDEKKFTAYFFANLQVSSRDNTEALRGIKDFVDNMCSIILVLLIAQRASQQGRERGIEKTHDVFNHEIVKAYMPARSLPKSNLKNEAMEIALLYATLLTNTTETRTIWNEMDWENICASSWKIFLLRDVLPANCKTLSYEQLTHFEKTYWVKSIDFIKLSSGRIEDITKITDNSGIKTVFPILLHNAIKHHLGIDRRAQNFNRRLELMDEFFRNENLPKITVEISVEKNMQEVNRHCKLKIKNKTLPNPKFKKENLWQGKETGTFRAAEAVIKACYLTAKQTNYNRDSVFDIPVPEDVNPVFSCTLNFDRTNFVKE